MASRTLAGRYRLEAILGKGGMGVVHRATDLALGRPVAVKLLRDAADAQARERLVVEARRTAALRGPTIVEVFDVGQDDGDVFVVMELLEGEALSARVKREGGLDAACVVAIGASICDALSVAHDAGVVHRDLKPANVILLAGDPLRVKLLDFGIAKRMEGATDRTCPGELVGTLEYMAPEQIRGEALDGRADLYALGLTLYRAITGRSAVSGDNAATLVHAQLSETPEPPGASVRVSPALDAVIMRLLRKDPAGRFPDARATKRALLDAIEGRGDSPEAVPTPIAAARALPAIGPAPGGPPPWRPLPEVEPAPTAAARPAGRLELAADDRAPGVAFEIGAAPRPIGRAPREVPAIAPFAEPEGTGSPTWLAVLESVPTSVSKRVATYPIVALFSHRGFFDGDVRVSAALALVAAVGGACWYARRRAEGFHEGD